MESYLSAVLQSELFVILTVNEPDSFFGTQHMIVEPVLFVAPGVHVVISRRRLYTEEERSVINVDSEAVPLTVVREHSRMPFSEKLSQRSSARERGFSIAESEFVDDIVESLFEFVGFQIPANVFPRREEAVSASVKVCSEFTNLTGLSGQLL